MLVMGVGADDGADAQPPTMADTSRPCTVKLTTERLTILGTFIARLLSPETVAVTTRGDRHSRHVAHWLIEMTTASPPRLRIRPVRFALRCRITPDSFCIHRSPALAVPIAKP